MASAFEDFRKLTKLRKHSYYVLIPPKLISELRWREHQKLSVVRKGKKLIIEDWKKGK